MNATQIKSTATPLNLGNFTNEDEPIKSILNRAVPLTKKYDNCTMLERKAIDVCNFLNYEPYEVDYKDKKYYLLRYLGYFVGENDPFNESEDFEDFHTTSNLENIHDLISVAVFDDAEEIGLDSEKCFDDSIISFALCYDEERGSL